MKKVLLTLLTASTFAAVCASVAQAGSLNLDLRADSSSQTFNEEAGAKNTSRYYFKTIRLNYEGKVNDDLSFRVRAAYNKDATQLNSKGDTSVKALEYAYLTHKMSEDFSLTLGRMYSDHGAFEGATTGPDLYLASQSYTGKGVDGNDLSGNWLSIGDLLYVTGAKLSYTVMPDNTISLLSFKAPTNANPDENAMMTGLSYKGAFLDKSFKVLASYHIGNGTDSSKDKYNLMSAGFMYAADPVTVGVDYITSEFKEDAGGDKDSLTTVVAKVAYTGLEQWTPRLEYVSSENKIEIGGSSTDKYSGYGAVLEYNPMADYKGFRYHLAYHNMTGDLETGLKPNLQEVTIGARLYADFLK